MTPDVVARRLSDAEIGWNRLRAPSLASGGLAGGSLAGLDPKELILFLTMLIMAALEIFGVVVQYPAQGRIGRLSGGGISVEH